MQKEVTFNLCFNKLQKEMIFSIILEFWKYFFDYFIFYFSDIRIWASIVVPWILSWYLVWSSTFPATCCKRLSREGWCEVISIIKCRYYSLVDEKLCIFLSFLLLINYSNFLLLILRTIWACNWWTSQG